MFSAGHFRLWIPCRKAPHRHIALYRSLCQRRHRRPVAAQFLGSHPWKMVRHVMFIGLTYHEIWSSLIKYHEISWHIKLNQMLTAHIWVTFEVILILDASIICDMIIYDMNDVFVIWVIWYMWICWTKYEDLWLSVHKLFKCCSLPRWSSRGKRKRGKVVYTDRTCSSSKTSELRSEIATQNSKYAANWNILELFCSELGTCFEQKS